MYFNVMKLCSNFQVCTSSLSKVITKINFVDFTLILPGNYTLGPIIEHNYRTNKYFDLKFCTHVSNKIVRKVAKAQFRIIFCSGDILESVQLRAY